MEINGLSSLNGVREVQKNDQAPVPMKIRNNIKFPKTKQDMALISALTNSPLDERVPNKSSLKKMGFAEGMMDMNGGVSYANQNGDNIRICSSEGAVGTGMKGSTRVQYESKDGAIKHDVYYDPDGNPLKGVLVREKEDGSIERFEYEYDLEGHKTVTNYNKMVRG